VERPWSAATAACDFAGIVIQLFVSANNEKRPRRWTSGLAARALELRWLFWSSRAIPGPRRHEPEQAQR
jgi:hypothetical protein